MCVPVTQLVYKYTLHVHITKKYDTQCDGLYFIIVSHCNIKHFIHQCKIKTNKNIRNKSVSIITNLRARPNILKFKQILSAYQKQNICKFIRNITKSFVL